MTEKIAPSERRAGTNRRTIVAAVVAIIVAEVLSRVLVEVLDADLPYRKAAPRMCMFLISVGNQLPFLLCYIVGIAFAISRWRQHPQVSRFALIAFSFFLLSSLVGTVFASIQFGMRPGQDSFYLVSIIRFALFLCTPFAWGFLIAAIFGWRKT